MVKKQASWQGEFAEMMIGINRQCDFSHGLGIRSARSFHFLPHATEPRPEHIPD